MAASTVRKVILAWLEREPPFLGHKHLEHKKVTPPSFSSLDESDRLIDPIMRWLTMLADLVRHPTNDPPTTAKAATYRALLLQDGIRPEVWSNLASLHYVAGQTVFWPAYSELQKHIWAFQKEHYPAKALPAPQPPVSDRDKELAIEWDDPCGILHIVRNIEANANPQYRRGLLMQLAAAVHQHAPQHEHLVIIPPETPRGEQPDKPQVKPAYLPLEQANKLLGEIRQRQLGRKENE